MNKLIFRLTLDSAPGRTLNRLSGCFTAGLTWQEERGISKALGTAVGLGE